MRLQQHERSACACGACRQVCHTQPGMLAPGDLQRICRFLDIEPTQAFLEANFRADGRPARIAGENVQLPVLVPETTEAGLCVFLGKTGKCTIHPVAPFGCSRVNACDPPQRRRRAIQTCCNAIARSMRYLNLWTRLAVSQVSPLK